jgi:hypothetical protein
LKDLPDGGAMLGKARRSFMRRALFLTILTLAACNAQPSTSSAQTTASATTADSDTPAVAPWFICDGVDAPAVFEVEQAGKIVRVAEYAKPSGALANRSEYDEGEGDAGMSHMHYPLLRDGQDAGVINETSSGPLEPGIVYTPVITDMRLGDRNITCRWMPRTRLIGFTGRRSFVIYEGDSGDLIYTTYNFADAANQHPIDLSTYGQTTTFSLEVRSGNERIAPDHTEYRFDNNGYTYVITANKDQTGSIAVLHGGQQVQSEPITAFEVGTGPH